jgi:flagellar hook-associated protein 3 FlgL
MNYVSLGDMARSFQLRRHNVELQKRLSTLTEELTTGVKSDVAGAVSGDFKALSGIEHSLHLSESYKTAASEAGLFAATLQDVLGTVQDLAADIAPTLLNAGTTGGAQLVNTTTTDARQKFHSAVSALNTQIADRFLLSGAATDQKPLRGSQDILDALMATTTGQTTASGVINTVQAWFDAPPGGGGFADVIYGGAGTQSAFEIGPNDSAALDVTALDPAVVDVLKGMALAALVAEGVLPGDATGRALLSRTAGEALYASNSDLASLRARVGTVEAHIADTVTRNAAQSTALDIARTQILAADPYETATGLEAVQTQIETLYTITSRLSRLSLADFLR